MNRITRALLPRGKQRRRRGAAAIECAIILPVLATIVFGCVDFGRFAHSYIAVSNAARAGAGFASFHPFTATTQAAWERKTHEAITEEFGDLLQAEKLSIVGPTIVATGQRRVQVGVTYNFETFLQWPGIPSTMEVGHTVEMRCIR